MLVALACSGCTSEVKRAQQRYDFLKEQDAAYSELCLAGEALLKAMTDALDSDLSVTRAIVGTDCDGIAIYGADARPGQPEMQADNLDAVF